jgi:hypothetical protein
MDCLEQTKLATCLQRCLPHLRGLMSCFWKVEDLFYSVDQHLKNADDVFGYRYLTAVRTTIEPSNAQVDQSEYWDQQHLIFRTFGWNTNYPIFKQLYQSGDQSNGQSVDQSNGQSVDQSNGQSGDQSNGQSVNHTVSQSINHTVSQSIEQTCRAAFFAALYDDLDEEDQKSLIAWDAGNYYADQLSV